MHARRRTNNERNKQETRARHKGMRICDTALSLALARRDARPNKKKRMGNAFASRRQPLNLAHLAALRRPAGGRAPPGVRSGPWLFGRGKR